MGDAQRSDEKSLSQLPRVTMYTDGAAEPNPGKGGYGVVLLHPKKRLELSAGFQLTTNNRMELLGVIAGLEALKKPCRVSIHSDSKYVVDSISKGWILKWQKKNWARGENPVPNFDLWQRYLVAAASHEISIHWVKGHAGHEHNERCDVLAVAAANGAELQVDNGYRPKVPATEPVASGNPIKGADSSSAGKSSDASPPSKKKKLTHKQPGEPCRNCGTAIEKRVPKKQKLKANQTYCYAWYLYCPGCTAMYMVEEAKVLLSTSQKSIFDDSDDVAHDV